VADISIMDPTGASALYETDDNASMLPKPSAKVPKTSTGARENLGITEALLDDPEYGEELKRIFVLFRAGRKTEAQDELYKTKFGRLRKEAQDIVLERAERSEIYKENLRKFIIDTRKILRELSLDATDEQLEAYYVKGTPVEIIKDDVIKTGTFKPEDIGGTGLDNLTLLKRVARSNGVAEKNIPTLLGFNTMDEVGRALASGQDITVFEKKLRNYGATAMPEYIRKQIDSGLDLDDAIAPYRTALADELEIPLEQVDVTDRTIQDALANNYNLSQFRRAIRKDARWQYTDNAKNTVVSTIRAVLGGTE
jgi:hypothetical protein